MQTKYKRAKLLEAASSKEFFAVERSTRQDEQELTIVAGDIKKLSGGYRSKDGEIQGNGL